MRNLKTLALPLVPASRFPSAPVPPITWNSSCTSSLPLVKAFSATPQAPPIASGRSGNWCQARPTCCSPAKWVGMINPVYSWKPASAPWSTKKLSPSVLKVTVFPFNAKDPCILSSTTFCPLRNVAACGTLRVADVSPRVATVARLLWSEVYATALVAAPSAPKPPATKAAVIWVVAGSPSLYRFVSSVVPAAKVEAGTAVGSLSTVPKGWNFQRWEQPSAPSVARSRSWDGVSRRWPSRAACRVCPARAETDCLVCIPLGP
mmetsp:Transcript_93294/g.213280  ORF Transcript_93294/g.213280 Transcript_93294/m.213280 type:complete len:262 (-) Transcript_93294:1443-2228(-)